MCILTPGAVECVVNLRKNDGHYTRITAIVDTGAEISLFPETLRADLEFRQTERESVEIEQAGIASQVFTAKEGFVKIFLEDAEGHQSSELEIRTWFGATDQPLLGFAGVLDRAKVFIDMAETRTGWIEI